MNGDEGTMPLLITNQHVLRGGHSIKIFLHESAVGEMGRPSGKFRAQNLLLNDDLVVRHPNHNVDLCAVYAGPLLNNFKTQYGTVPFYKTLSNNLIPTYDQLRILDAIEDVVMVGYPIGLWDTAHNFPISRNGITASHPGYDFCGKSNLLIDCACFPGSSGSPVMLIRKGFSLGKTGGIVVGGTRVMFLGVLSAVYQMTAEGTVQPRDIPTRSVQVAQTHIPAGLGIVIKSIEVLSLVRHAMHIAKGRS
jgi:hypothetical protein